MNAPAKIYSPVQWVPGMEIVEGIYMGMPEDVYFGTFAMSNSGLKDFAIAPAKYMFGEREQTRSQALGKLWHTALLEPAALESRYYVTQLKRIDERTAAYKVEAELAGGREIIKVAEWDEALRMCASICGQRGSLPEVLSFPGRHVELSFFWWDFPSGVFCRARADVAVLEHLLVGDLKSCQDAGEDFNYAVRDWKYHYQNAFYKRGLRKLGYPIEDFVFWAIEKKKPFLYAPWNMPRDATEEAERNILKLLQQYRECLDTKFWGGYPQHIRTVEYPEQWLNKERVK